MKQIAPGGNTTIAVKVSTKGYGGKPITETVKIHTNDRSNPDLKVMVMGFVDKFADIDPPMVSLNGLSGTEIKAQVTITTREQYPFKVVNVRARNGQYVKSQLGEIKGSKPQQYKLTLENIQSEKRRYSEVIYLDTDNKLQPSIEIRVTGNVF